MKATTNEVNRYDELQIIASDFARQGNTKDLKILLTSGMSVDSCDKKGNTLLMLSSYNGNLETTQLLILFGAEVDKKNNKGQTPLAGVCFKGYLDIVKELVNAGASIYENTGMGTNPILLASIFGNYEIVKFLSEKNKNNNLKFKIYLLISKIISSLKKIR
uniref:ankyrin repeat domain-containing protein n=1 Tax=Aliarcobacter sp. TaxID=2321116 RepID=UPI0040486201